MVLAIMGFTDVHLVENNQQKVAFLKEVADNTRTKVTIHNVKIESVRDLIPDVIVSRALASLDNLLTLGERFFDMGTVGLFPKGKKAQDEIAEARKHWQFELKTFPSLTSDESSILRLTRIRRKV